MSRSVRGETIVLTGATSGIGRIAAERLAAAGATVAAVAKVDVEALPGAARELGAQGVPTLVCYADGEPVERLVGARDRATLEALIDRHG